MELLLVLLGFSILAFLCGAPFIYIFCPFLYLMGSIFILKAFEEYQWDDYDFLGCFGWIVFGLCSFIVCFISFARSLSGYVSFWRAALLVGVCMLVSEWVNNPDSWDSILVAAMILFAAGCSLAGFLVFVIIRRSMCGA